MKKTFILVTCIVFIFALFLVSCEKKEEAAKSAPAAGYGEKPAAAGYGEKPAAAGYGEKPAAAGYGEKPAAGGYGGK